MSDLKCIRAVVADERELILSGRLSELPALAARKESYLSAKLRGAPPSRPELEAIRRDLLSNQALFEAAAKGIRAALTRVEEIRAVGSSLTAYDARGKNVCHGQAAPVLERRV